MHAYMFKMHTQGMHFERAHACIYVFISIYNNLLGLDRFDEKFLMGANCTMGSIPGWGEEGGIKQLLHRDSNTDCRR